MTPAQKAKAVEDALTPFRQGDQVTWWINITTRRARPCKGVVILVTDRFIWVQDDRGERHLFHHNTRNLKRKST